VLVISTANHPLMWRFHQADMLRRVLNGPMPDVHLVFKLHPGETDEGPYRGLVEDAARGSGYSPPPVTIVRDIDLYRLLAGADAHLGIFSTVLTDAVVVGVPNLIVAGQAAGDLLGYVEAGVARPVRDSDELRAALDHPIPPDPARRRAFLDRHFRQGDAGTRIVDDVLAGTSSYAGRTDG